MHNPNPNPHAQVWHVICRSLIWPCTITRNYIFKTVTRVHNCSAYICISLLTSVRKLGYSQTHSPFQQYQLRNYYPKHFIYRSVCNICLPAGSGMPQFKLKLSDTSARQGDTVRFQANVIGNPTPRVLWHREVCSLYWYTMHSSHFKTGHAIFKYEISLGLVQSPTAYTVFKIRCGHDLEHKYMTLCGVAMIIGTRIAFLPSICGPVCKRYSDNTSTIGVIGNMSLVSMSLSYINVL